ncbi:putative lovastatin nonaketide synthase [Stipitochalara longipes BDJ]|nr:putative lovastatin nonaketide synthase [Stipitochalara longipes BDJ]
MEDKQEPIAIVGMSCRFPGEAENPQGFFEMLARGENAWSEVPKSRFDIDAYYHPSVDRDGTIATKSGFFLKQDVSKWDAAFFSTTALEAAGMDPQQRILLEVTYEAFENGWLETPFKALTDYSQLSSWLGPSMTIDTACSSGLVALHLGVQSIRTGEASMAVVGGSNLILEPGIMRGLSALHFLSPDGKCHSFDASANGYGRGEGMGVMVLKPLKDALRDNDTIRGVIRGTGLNQDGKTPAITMPSSEAQAELIQSTYREAGLEFDRTSFFEAHGTGTVVGDPRELKAIGLSVGVGRSTNNPLYVGSVKTSLGHLESAAGVAGLMKAVFSLEKGVIPGIVGLETVNPRLKLKEWGLTLNKQAVEWPTPGLRRASVNSFGYGGANAHVILDDAKHYLEEHGLHGHHSTLGHDAGLSNTDSDSAVSIGTPPLDFNMDQHKPSLKLPKLFGFSSPDQEGITRLARTYAKHFETAVNLNQSSETTYVEDLAYTLNERRTIFGWRTFVVTGSIEGFQDATRQGLPKLPRTSKNPACAFIFTGQGAQYFKMGYELQSSPKFYQILREADDYLLSLGSNWSVQPLCTVLQVALVDILEYWGIAPKAVVGHSSGEIAAAYAAGALSREDAWKIAYFRGLYSSSLPTKRPDISGAMMAVALSEEQAHHYKSKVTTGKLVVACVNSSSSVTVSGDKVAIEELEQLFKENDIWCRKLKVNTAYHSHHMEFIAEEYLESIKDIQARAAPSAIPMFSSVTGEKISPCDLGPAYWVQNMLSPVLFSKATIALLMPSNSKVRLKRGTSVQSIVEIGPHGVLKGPLNQILAASQDRTANSITYTSALERGKNAYEMLLRCAGNLWAQGHPVNLNHVNCSSNNSTSHKLLSDLPPYPWNHEKSHWHEARANLVRKRLPAPRTDLLGRGTETFNTMNSEFRWSNFIKPQETPWILDHVIQGLVVLPGSTMISMALEACQQIIDQSKTIEGFELRDINFTRALMFQSPDQKIEVSMEFKPHMLGTKESNYVWHRFHMTSISKDNIITEHGNGLIRIYYAASPSIIENGMETTFEARGHKDMYESIYNNCTTDIHSSLLYAELERQGMQFGPLFRLLSDVRGGPDMGCAILTIPDTASVMPKNFEYPLLLHPAVLDGFFQTVYSRTNSALGLTVVISSIGSIYVSASLPNTPGTILKCYQTSKITGHRDTKATIVISDAEFSKPLVIIKNEVSTAVGSVGPSNSSGEDPSTKMLASRLVWKEDVSSFSRSTAKKDEIIHVGNQQDDVRRDALLEYASQIYIRRAIRNLDDSGSELFPKIAWLRDNLSNAYVCSPAEEDILLSKSAKISLVGKAVELLGTNLVRIIDGTIDPSELLQNHGINSPEIKADAIFNKQLESKLIALFDTAGDNNPDLQILEISNGCASTTASILKVLSGKKDSGCRYGHYTLADIDQSRVVRTKQLLKDFANITIQELQLTSDFTKQNFEGKRFDIVLVNSLLPTSPCAEFALENAQQLLRAGGRLVIVAPTKLANWTTLIFGTIDGWLKHGPQKTRCKEAVWGNNLAEHGMLAPQITIIDSHVESANQMTMVVSASPKKPVQTTQTVVILENPHSSPDAALLAKRIIEQLALQGFSTSRAIIASIPDPSEKIFISLIDLDAPLLDGISAADFDSLKTLLLSSAGILWISRGGIVNSISLPHHYSTLGLFRTIRSESPHLRLFNMDLSPTSDLKRSTMTSLILEIFNRSFSEDDDSVVEHEFAEEEDVIFVPRLIQDETLNLSLSMRKSEPTPETQRLFQSGRPLKCIIGEIGLLDTLRFVDREEYTLPLHPEDVDVQILYTGLNFVDVMASLGYVQSTALGAEFTGIVTKIGSNVPERTFEVGQMVVGANEHCLASNIRSNWRTLQAVPKSLAPEAAATCLIVYSTAYFALYKNAKLKKEDTILIHYAAGGLGQAALQLAQHIGATVYCTVGSLEKKKLLMERYGIPENRIFNSRDTTFAKGVMRETKGRGVDLILNSTFGEMLRESWNCLADFGIFVEVGKRDILANNFLEMGPFIRGCTFTAVNLAQYTEKCEPHRLMVYNEVVREVFKLLAEGHITPPYPLTVMSITEAEEALRILQSGKHAGKIALKMSQDDMVSVLPRKDAPLEMDQTSTYLLAGGLGGIGKSLADLMVKHGAKHIAFMSRSGDASVGSQAYLATLRGQGVQAIAYACDITKREEVELKIAECSAEMPKVKGFVNCAMNLRDTIFENMSYSDWVAASASKIQGSWNMHEVLPADMDFFIMLSSTSGIIGHPGQANYAAGNTFQNGLAHYRQKKGLKATSIDLGAVAGIGYLAENADTYEKYPHLLKMVVKEDEIHHIFLTAVAGTIKEEPIHAQLTTGIIGGEVLRSIMPFAPWANDSKFVLLRKADGQSDSSPRGDPTREAFIESESLTEAAGVIEAALVTRLAKALGISSEDINTEQPLHAYGVDSLIAVEVRNWVMKELKSDISILDILSPLPIHSLALKIGERSKILPARLRNAASD